jgi:hypothetical protein
LLASAILCVSSLFLIAFPIELDASISSLANFNVVVRPDLSFAALISHRNAKVVPRYRLTSRGT